MGMGMFVRVLARRFVGGRHMFQRRLLLENYCDP